MRKKKDLQYLSHLHNVQLEPNWKALLSNDEIIYQDDYQGSSWRDLQEYCRENKVYPIHVTLEFWDNILNILPPNAEGYFYRKGILTELMCAANPQEGMPFQGNRAKTVIVGYYKDKLLYTTTIRVPELQIWDTEVRDEKKMMVDGIFRDKSLFLIENKCTPANTPTDKSLSLNT